MGRAQVLPVLSGRHDRRVRDQGASYSGLGLFKLDVLASDLCSLPRSLESGLRPL